MTVEAAVAGLLKCPYPTSTGDHKVVRHTPIVGWHAVMMSLAQVAYMPDPCSAGCQRGLQASLCLAPLQLQPSLLSPARRQHHHPPCAEGHHHAAPLIPGVVLHLAIGL